MKHPTKKIAKARAWKACSEYSRRKTADQHTGLVSCVTCGKTKHWKATQAGHWIPQAQGDACRFIEDNIWCQCYRCNINLGGNGPEYAAFMEKEVGKERMEELRQLSKTTKHYSVSDYLALEIQYKAKINELSR